MITVFGLQHLLYLIISFIITGFLVYFAFKVRLDNQKRQLYIKILGLIYLCFIVINRISCAYYWGPDFGGCEPFLPGSFCGTISFFFSISILIFNKDSSVFHFFCYLGFFAGIIPTFYPTYIGQGADYGYSTIFFMPTITSLICHSFMFAMAVILIVSGYVEISLNRIWSYPLGYALLTLYGELYNVLYNTNKGFNIGVPIISNFTSPLIFVYSFSILLTFLFLFDLIKYKKNSFIFRMVQTKK